MTKLTDSAFKTRFFGPIQGPEIYSSFHSFFCIAYALINFCGGFIVNVTLFEPFQCLWDLKLATIGVKHFIKALSLIVLSAWGNIPIVR